ncbi:MAG: proprotein convertase P-domain-containing protein [Luteolibacter sp.]
MKIVTFPAVGLLVIAGSAHLLADPLSAASKTLNPVKVPDAKIGDAPYRFNGAVISGNYRGSGFCAWNRKTFFSAAHVVFDDEAGLWSSPPVWYPHSNAAVLDDDQSIKTRGYYRWTNYSELVALDGNNGDAFGRDVILAYAFKNLISGSPAKLNLRGTSDLRNDIKSMITGYPAVNAYTGKPIEGYFMHQTGPGVTPYKTYAGNSLTTTLISTGGGNSGGPVWTKNPDVGWTAAGVLVGGLPSESVVYAFSGDINALTRAVTPVIKSDLPHTIDVDRVSTSSRFFLYDHSKTIPDGVPKWTEFPISVGGFEVDDKVQELRLTFKITTHHRGDLQVVLAGPGGFEVLVHNEQGAGKDNLVLKNADFSSFFAGIDPTGKWSLRVQDRLKGDIATVEFVQLEISVDGTAVSAP